MKSILLYRRFIIRQIIRSRKQATVFVMCVTLSIVALIALNGFSISVHTSLLKEAKTLHAADILVRSHHELSTSITDAVSRLEDLDLIKSAQVYEFYSVVRAGDDQGSLLAKLKIVTPGYPFYGNVALQSGRKLKSVLSRGRIIVAPALLDRLKLRIGDQLHIGQALLTIEDVVLEEPDQPVNFFFLGPRIFISEEDLERLDLVKKGSRVHFTRLIKVDDEKSIDRIADQLTAAADPDFERVDTYRTAESGVKRFFDNFLFFLSLIGIFILLLAGIGIQSSLAAFLKEKEKTIAIMKTLGATSGFFTRHFVIILALLGFLGSSLGLLFGFFLQHFIDRLFTGFLPPNVKLIISWNAVIGGLGLGVLVVALFSFLPLYRLKELKPVSIFRKEFIYTQKGLPYYTIGFVIFLFFIGMVLWQINVIKTGLYFVLGIILLILITAAATEIVLYFLRKLNVRTLTIRQALKGLFRPKNATKAIIITLTASLSVIFSIYLLEQNLDAGFIESYPPDAPNLFFLDIQPDQLDNFSQTLGLKTEYYPIVRARMIAINGEKINRQKEKQKRGDNLSRIFNLTYRNRLITDEVIIKGKKLYRDDWGDLQVSVLDKVIEMRELDIGDRITFKIQGIPLEATVSSVRTHSRESIRPYFYFVFPEKALQDAPQTIFTAIRVEKSRIPALQTKIVKKFPNINVIDVTQTLSIFAKVLKKLSNIIRFFTLFSLVAGVLIIFSSVLATRFARIQEAVYYKILGARGAFVLKVFILENLFIGLVSASLALLFSQIGSWAICTREFDITYHMFLFESLLMVLGAALFVVGVGLLPSVSILRQKPVLFLREQTDE